ncbi:hypothetical protein ACIRUY_01405 [Streptomyces erythrochromogenes]|uniref:hypothetical protein n=1 Tax=Streptomyces erythrochromogenes TaxID=285574 RepID=UPI0037F953FF
MKSISVTSKLREMLLEQDDAGQRLVLCRLTTGAAVVRTVWHLPPGDFMADYADMLNGSGTGSGTRRALQPHLYEGLRVLAATSAAAWALGNDHPAVKITANASFALLQRYVVAFHEDLWSYNSHLNVFLGALSLTRSSGDSVSSPGASQAHSALLAALQAYYAAMYLQSGISKFVGAGWKWTGGSALHGAWGELGTHLGKRLASHGGSLPRALSTATLAYELAFVPVLLLAWRRRALLGLSSAAFHGAVKATLDISFWHLSWFSAPLFVVPASLAEPVVEAIQAPRRSKLASGALVAAGVAVAAAPLVRALWGKRNRR